MRYVTKRCVCALYKAELWLRLTTQLRKEVLVQAINDLTKMHAMATKQKDLLEEAAFVSVGRLVWRLS